jgi:hypothetical protein
MRMRKENMLNELGTLTGIGRQGIDCRMNTAAILISGIICG